MQFEYSTTGPSQDEFDSLPRLPLVLRLNNQSFDVCFYRSKLEFEVKPKSA